MDEHLTAWQLAEFILGGWTRTSSRKSIGTLTSAWSA